MEPAMTLHRLGLVKRLVAYAIVLFGKAIAVIHNYSVNQKNSETNFYFGWMKVGKNYNHDFFRFYRNSM